MELNKINHACFYSRSPELKEQEDKLEKLRELEKLRQENVRRMSHTKAAEYA